MGIRLLIPTVLATWLPVAAAEATFVEFSIFGDGGASTVEIGPDGGTVPYTLFVETDPLDTPENLGLGLILITIDTDTGVAQLPTIQFEPPFTDGWLFGLYGDDVVGIRWSQLQSRRRPPFIRLPGLGQSGPQGYAHGELVIPPASV